MNPSTWRQLARASQFLILLAVLASTTVITRANQGSAAPAAEPEPRVYLPLVLGGGATTPSDPITVRFIDDTARAAHAAIGPEGGTLSATAADGTRFELVVPAEALDFSETITMTPVLRAENLPLSGGLIGAVNLEPAGLTFYEPATLRIIPATTPPGPLTVGFAFEGSGQEFHLQPTLEAAGQLAVQSADAVITTKVVSSRGYGAASGTREDVRRQQDRTGPSNPADELDESFVPLPAPPERIPLLEVAFTAGVYPQLQAAETNSTLLDQAILTYSRWFAYLEQHGLTIRFAEQIVRAHESLARSLKHAASVSAERCYTQKRPEEGFRLLRLLGYAKKYMSSAEAAAIEAKLAKCLVFKLTFHSKMTEMIIGRSYIYELKSEVILRAANSTRVTGTAPLEWVDFRWVGTSPCSYITQGSPSTFNVALSLTPVSRTSPAANVNLRYNPGAPIEHVTMQCAGRTYPLPPGTAWNDYFTLLHQYEWDNEGVNATVQIMNVGSFTGWVYHNTGGPNDGVVEDTQIDLAHAPEH